MFHIEFLVLLFVHYSCADGDGNTFPENFLFGVASAAYQVEGAWNESGKTENIWDYATRTNPSCIKDNSNAEVACDSYHKYEEDVNLIADLGVNFYRFSISWTRLIPNAVSGSDLNPDGVAYYNNLIKKLEDKGIESYVTIFHWDTPQLLEERGGWRNETIIDDYVYYAKMIFEKFGDRVKKWITFNEPKQTCLEGYELGVKAPFMKTNGVGCYKCYHNMVRAHGKVYRMYQEEYKSKQQGEVGITVDTFYAFPLTSSLSDSEAAEMYMQFYYGWFVNPIILGNYPRVMIENIDANSKQEGLDESRLPKFTEDEIQMVKGSFDFLGLNHYSSLLTTFGEPTSFPNSSHERDCGVQISRSNKWTPSASSWLFEVPSGFYNLLLWIKEHYNNPTVIVTENGWATGEELEDTGRVHYMKSYLAQLLRAKNEGCNVIGYTFWSILDNFEWTDGYSSRFGLTYVNFTDDSRPRKSKKSYDTYKTIVKTKSLNDVV